MDETKSIEKAEKVFAKDMRSNILQSSTMKLFPAVTIFYAEKVDPPGNIPNNRDSYLVQCTWNRTSYSRLAEVEVEMSVSVSRRIIHLHCWQNRFSKSDPRFVRLGTYTLARALELCRTKFHISSSSTNTDEHKTASKTSTQASTASEPITISMNETDQWKIKLVAHGNLEQKPIIGLLQLYLELGFEPMKLTRFESGETADFDMAGGTRMHGDFENVYRRVRQQAQLCPLFIQYKLNAPDQVEI